LLAASIYQKAAPIWLLCEQNAVELNGMETEFDEGFRRAGRQPFDDLCSSDCPLARSVGIR
jgi:hypothetical protein